MKDEGKRVGAGGRLDIFSRRVPGMEARAIIYESRRSSSYQGKVVRVGEQWRTVLNASNLRYNRKMKINCPEPEHVVSPCDLFVLYVP